MSNYRTRTIAERDAEFDLGARRQLATWFVNGCRLYARGTRKGRIWPLPPRDQLHWETLGRQPPAPPRWLMDEPAMLAKANGYLAEAGYVIMLCGSPRELRVMKTI